MKAHCKRVTSLPVRKSISPRPIRLFAPVRSRIVWLSIRPETRNAIRAGKFALILPVMMVARGLWVAITI